MKLNLPLSYNPEKYIDEMLVDIIANDCLNICLYYVDSSDIEELDDGEGFTLFSYDEIRERVLDNLKKVGM